MVHSAVHAKLLYPIPGETKWESSTILKHATSKDQAILSQKSKKKNTKQIYEKKKKKKKLIKMNPFFVLLFNKIIFIFSSFSNRLACCVLVEKWMNEMIISIP